jgi:hypothetical protein
MKHACSKCNKRIPSRYMEAHLRYHEQYNKIRTNWNPDLTRYLIVPIVESKRL